MRKKACTTCKVVKGMKAFYWLKPGRKMAICKECQIIAVAENRKAKAEYYKAYFRRINKRPDRLAQMAAYKKTPAGRECSRVYYRFKKALAA